MYICMYIKIRKYIDKLHGSSFEKGRLRHLPRHEKQKLKVGDSWSHNVNILSSYYDFYCLDKFQTHTCRIIGIDSHIFWNRQSPTFVQFWQNFIYNQYIL